MTFAKKESGRAPVLQMTALMDVIFLLLCFFVTTSVFSQWETEIALKLPVSKSATVPGRLPGEVILNVTSSGAVFVNNVYLTLDDLTVRLARISEQFKGQPVVIRADRETQYETIVKVMDACRKANIWNFSFATKEKED